MDANVSTGRIKTPGKYSTNALELLSAILFLSALTLGEFPGLCVALRSNPVFSRTNGRAKSFCHRKRAFSTQSASLTHTSLLSSSRSESHVSRQEDPDAVFPNDRPLLAIITETDACDSEDKMQRTYTVIEKATSTGKVDLVSVRLSLPPRYDENGVENSSYLRVMERACRLTKELVGLSSKQMEQAQRQNNEIRGDNNTAIQSPSSFKVVCSSDLVSVAVDARANGIHVKEHHLENLADILARFDYPIVIGTSTHSVESALKSYFHNGSFENDEDHESKNPPSSTRRRPDYYFVGTCYLTASHPEKTSECQLEGPALPGRVKRAICETLKSKQLSSSTKESSQDSSSMESLQLESPPIMAIGGIDETNCHEPVALGADGVAVIRAVLQADHPMERVEGIQRNMMETYTQLLQQNQ
mmetsp:Transcript_6200/g.15348  ORF Transcript_6200/g.15348 Transcript_6200/m.15348 type:complete len:416 (+) Transcript_6200:194-1441(+)|eukprot:CAMPEP_0197175524 /NCGR_PEP_ID=MMETSP1423-20130617/1722_1 /TAXON_ID=476441 /ORGANISM="Pseudo-nitzschia heimii, Strain UNC1101" /LENGTH=415 /DNA_ID=CAMNT_0042624703 /DNA_START=146 /DNA_END=1393 /DNA_ORIENTATION=+